MMELPKPDDIVGMSFWLITMAMLALAVFLFAERRRLAPRWQAVITLVAVAALVTGFSYLRLSQGWAASGSVATAYRFADWQLTVPLLVLSFHFLLVATSQPSPALFWRLLVSSAVLVAAGYLGAANFISPTLGFLVGLAGGLYVLGELYLGEAGRLISASDNKKLQATYNALRLIVTIGWAIYPLAYFMEYLGGGVDGGSINLIYNLADFLNRIAFGLVIYHLAAGETAREVRR
jgi:bacteriorhodopsin